MESSQRYRGACGTSPGQGELESHREETFIDRIHNQKNHIEQELLLPFLRESRPFFDGRCRAVADSILLATRRKGDHTLTSQPA